MTARLRTASMACALAAALSGCATSAVQNGPLRYAAAGTCVDALSALPARQIPAPDKNGKPAVFVFDANVSCLSEAPNTPRPGLLFSLTGVATPAEVLIDSSGSGAVTLAPLVRVLGADFHEQSRYSFDRFAKRGRDFSISVFLNSGSAPPAAYLLIVPDDAWLGRENLTVEGQQRTTVWSTGLVTGAYTSGYEEKSVSTFSDLGSLSIQARPYAAPAAAKTP
jgi:hypothetical protein